MNLPEFKSYEDRAVDLVVTIINRAKFDLGERQNLFQLSQSRDIFAAKYKVCLSGLSQPYSVNAEYFIRSTIERIWRLTKTFLCSTRYVGTTQDTSAQFYYFEAIFSQPRADYPIPQVTVSVFFRLEDRLIKPPETRVPLMYFRVEGQHTSHDIRHVLLTVDHILAVMQVKHKLFKSIEYMRIF